MKNQSPCLDTLPFVASCNDRIAFVSGRGVFMEKPKLIKLTDFRAATPTSKAHEQYGLFECPYDGTIFETVVRSVKSGNTLSCGCLQRKAAHDTSFKHGMHGTRLYRIHNNMIQRCTNLKNDAYEYYGGRGIIVCDEWLQNFITFKDWAITNGYKANLELDRIKTTLGYSPENCHWTNHLKNSQNKNLIQSNNTSGYRGVSYNKNKRKYEAYITDNGIVHKLGYHNTKEAAAQVRDNWVVNHNKIHPLNIIPKT